MAHQDHRGVMDAGYARGRDEKLHLAHRLKVRAAMTVDAFHRLHPRVAEVQVLEMGAADGKTLLQIRELLGGGGHYVGVELSAELLAAAPELPANVELLSGDVQALPGSLEDDRFHLCAALALLEHLDDPLVAVKEAFRVLRPGGVFVASSPNPLWDKIAGHLGMVADEFHTQEITPRRLRDLAHDAGFESIEFRPFMWVVTSFLPYLNVAPEPDLALRIDSLLRRIPFSRLAFVNQAVVGRKPSR